ncbi:uncharacterized protein CIMG_13159 [Coccidioides immitis RS]|uniref:Uncharacterized protein n=1 Tax=Coccidioides immitis (strain RS) TaxID=246410 RepID=A0A0D8JUB9_COCIM|nr:uncharacterized protein CIMG_13159 [Coccidioides immitis RS]KJF60709.1 hypothetical protein CIMG_13159 [Coccidioides immitis RS]
MCIEEENRNHFGLQGPISVSTPPSFTLYSVYNLAFPKPRYTLAYLDFVPTLSARLLLSDARRSRSTLSTPNPRGNQPFTGSHLILRRSTLGRIPHTAVKGSRSCFSVHEGRRGREHRRPGWCKEYIEKSRGIECSVGEIRSGGREFA